MANLKERHPENVPGPWYVDTSCIQCGLCSEYAPASFRESPDGTQNIVHHQPITNNQINAALEVKEGCPVDAIGNDG
ncbi:ferredoxin [Pedosphaera parvula]|uniref:Zn-dependent hydrolase, glyoxylase family n=1 Tax=Pedosphaera parvula (strain Ellin514) TaxID=320771 RepID=B9XKJ2_PEDPL|nr:ferredoxin [Pedosphaera parvula]EEF59662.1 Zn-dependent hydrolase, glyoxylase family [Pedosphaera parvula Ellin514]